MTELEETGLTPKPREHDLARFICSTAGAGKIVDLIKKVNNSRWGEEFTKAKQVEVRAEWDKDFKNILITVWFDGHSFEEVIPQPEFKTSDL